MPQAFGLLPTILYQARRYGIFITPGDDQPLEYSTIKMFSDAVNREHFHKATEIGSVLRKKYEPHSHELNEWPLDVPMRTLSWIENDKLKFPTFLSKDKKTAITDAADQIDTLFSKPSQCISLLGEAEQVLNQAAKDLSLINPGKGFFIKDKLMVPSAPEEEYGVVKFDHTLPNIIGEKLSKHGIGSGTPPFFSGFIQTEEANKIVKNQEIFCELPYTGNFILHGLYSHLIQWYILAVAYEKGILKFNGNLSLSDMLAASVDVSDEKYNSSLWVHLFDSENSYAAYRPLKVVSRHFGQPTRLNTTLLFSNALPTLQSWLLTYAWYMPIAELQHMLKDTYTQTIPYELLVLGQSLNIANTDSISFGFSRKQIFEQLCQNGSQLLLDVDTGIARRAIRPTMQHSDYLRLNVVRHDKTCGVRITKLEQESTSYEIIR